ncbi:MAG: alpha/beta fold hydrolase [Burkholderiales bacterium]|nr:alpha/beta fold hydrolase [Burkholderiales bacterium]
MEWLAVVLALVVGVPAAAYFFQERLIFFPQPVAGVPRLPPRTEPLELTAADGTRLAGWVRHAERTPAPALIYFGGNAEEVSWTLADARWPRDWTVVAVNYRGYGKSEGAPGEGALSADALEIYDAVAKLPGVDPRRIVAFGRSLGSGIAVHLAAHRPVAGVILVSPYDSLVAMGRTHYPWLPVGLLLRHRFDSAARAPSLAMPLLVVVAEHDAIVPEARSRALYDAWGGPKTWVVVPRTDHNTLSGPDGLWDATTAFLERLR